MAPFSPGPIFTVLPGSQPVEAVLSAHAKRSAPVGPGTHASRQVWHHFPQDQYLQSSHSQAPSQWNPCTVHMRRDLLQWDQALTLADRYGTIFPKTNIYSPPRLPARRSPAHAQRSATVGPGTHASRKVWHHFPQDHYLQSSQAPSQWKPCIVHMRRDLLQWDQALTLADRYGTSFPRTNICSPPSQWRTFTCAEICSNGTRPSLLSTGMVPYTLSLRVHTLLNLASGSLLNSDPDL